MILDKTRLVGGDIGRMSLPDVSEAEPYKLGVTNGRIAVAHGQAWVSLPTNLGFVGPGASELIGGTMSAGFFGVVSNLDLIDGSTLCGELGMYAGKLFAGDTDWLKFAHSDKVLFYSKMIIRASHAGNNIGWSTLKNKDLVYGNTTLAIGSDTYKVRLLTDQEWDDLMYMISSDSPVSVDQRWASYDPAEIDVGDNLYSTCLLGDNNYANRGNPNVASSNGYQYLRWRPVLELVE